MNPETNQRGKKARPIGAADLVLLALCALFFLGMLSFIRPCVGLREDGSAMPCHWAGQALAGVSFAMFLLAALRFLCGAEMKRGVDLSLLVLSGLSALIPGHLIELCMMHTMRCHSLMAPGVFVFSILIAVLSTADMLLRGRERTKLERRIDHAV